MFETSIPHPNYRDGAIVELTVSSGFVQGGEFIFAVRADNRYGTSPFSEPVRMKVADSEPAKQLPGSDRSPNLIGSVTRVLMVQIQRFYESLEKETFQMVSLKFIFER